MEKIDELKVKAFDVERKIEYFQEQLRIAYNNIAKEQQANRKNKENE